MAGNLRMLAVADADATPAKAGKTHQDSWGVVTSAEALSTNYLLRVTFKKCYPTKDHAEVLSVALTHTPVHNQMSWRYPAAVPLSCMAKHGLRKFLASTGTLEILLMKQRCFPN
jgi:hypothetical protein